MDLPLAHALRSTRTLLVMLFVCLGTLSSGPAAAQDRIEDFSLFGWTAARSAELAITMLETGRAQTSFQADIEAARRDFQAAWNDPAAREKSAARLGELLYQKDILYAQLPIVEGVNAGWERSKAFNRLSGAPLDGGIPAMATAEFLIWIATLRGHLGVYEDDHLIFALASKPDELTAALQRSQPAYERYAELRDRAELERFLPPPAPRPGQDGSGAFKEQRIELLNPYRKGGSGKHDMAVRLRAIAARGQQMLRCIYGPVREQRTDGTEFTYMPSATFWYQSAPVDIQGLLNADQGGRLAKLGNKPVTRCPETYAKAQALMADNSAQHPATLQRARAKQDATDECGGDRSCLRRRMAR